MTQTISRMYATKADADAAAGELAKHGFGPEEVFVVGPPALADGEEPSQETIAAVAAEIVRGYVVKARAAAYAPKVARGATLVTVHAPFGVGFKATLLLNRHKPIDSGIAEPSYPRPRYDEAAPLSSGLMMPVRSSDPTPFATFWNLPTLLSSSAPLSDWLRYSTISKSPAPSSTLLHLPILSDSVAPMSSSFGLPLLR